MITSTIYHSFKAFYQTAPRQEFYSTSTSQVFTWIIFLVLLAQLQRIFVPYVLLRPVSYGATFAGRKGTLLIRRHRKACKLLRIQQFLDSGLQASAYTWWPSTSSGVDTYRWEHT